jgi:endonuclease/exonuclease/phosphatase family metal-dependent hydrolase
MRLATFNLENLFERPRIMNLPSNEEGRQVLKDYYQLSDLIEKEEYSRNDKRSILNIMERYEGLLERRKSEFITLNEIRGHLLNSDRTAVQVNGRNDWIGWFELKYAAIEEIAIENTARVINVVNADVLGMVEVEHRIAVNRFNDSVIPKVGGQKYGHTMVIDGNDDRGIDVGIMTRLPFDIKSIATHVDDTDERGQIFSRDCAEYSVSMPSGNLLLVLINHFKSQGYGSSEGNDRKRKRQAKRVREIYEERLSQGVDYIAIIGDLNKRPDHDSLEPLVRNGTSLIDIAEHPKFISDGRPGTYQNGTANNKLDYILMSPKLTDKVQQGGIERRGVWGGTNGTLFPHFPEIKKEMDAASDHAALWVDLNI